jgi:hypothetical protein
MARVGRLAGALLVETEGGYFLVGNTKEPCDWKKAGFEPPTLDPSAASFLKLTALPPIEANRPGVGIELGVPVLTIGLEGEPLARALAQRFLVERNGSVSERLWRLVIHRGVPDEDVPEDDEPRSVDANWLASMPAPIWKIVRDTVLRCI